jgi:hypothetical protein
MLKLALRVSLAGVFALGLVAAPPAARADDAKNLKILPHDMSKADIKKLMKGMSAALGVECEHCHNTDNFAEDTEKKEVARQMMKMQAEINKEFFKGEKKVGCLTCHNGQKEPKKP